MTTMQPFPAKVCAALERLEAVREAEKAREKDLCKHRKSTKDDFLALGPGQTNKHKSLALDHMRTLLQIDYCRNRIDTLADKIGETIRNGHQPGLFSDDSEIEDIVSREPDDDELFATLQEANKPKKDKKDPDQTTFDDDKPVGEPDTIDSYFPGRFKDQNGKEQAVNNMEHLQQIAAKKGPDVDIVPNISSTFGVTIEFKQGKTSRGTLTYIGKQDK